MTPICLELKGEPIGIVGAFSPHPPKSATGIIHTEKKRSVFLSVVGLSPFKLLVSPAKLSDKTFKQYEKNVKELKSQPPGKWHVQGGTERLQTDKPQSVDSYATGVGHLAVLHLSAYFSMWCAIGEARQDT